jgi:uncharacterized protein (TIGR04255 family)
MGDRSGILKNSPLEYAIASVRFAPLALLPQMIPQIHGRLRESMPLMQQVQQQVQFLVPGAPNFPQAAQAWQIMSSDRKLGAQIGTEQVLFFTTKYKRFTDFQEEIHRCLEVLFDLVKFMDVTAVGVRYVDRFKARDGETLSDYMAAGFLTPRVSPFEAVGGLSQYTYRLGEEQLAVRAIYAAELPSIPFDLIGLFGAVQGPAQPLQVPPLGLNQLLLDIDASRTFPVPNRVHSCDEIEGFLDSLHRRANAFFRDENVCTDHAFAVWKGENDVA